MMKPTLERCLALMLIFWSAPGAAQVSSAERGKTLYEARCVACHSVDTHRVGPMHRGVLGRTAGKVAAYDFSAALRASTLVWTQQNLLTWLQDPEKLIPDQQMGYRVDGLQDRLDIVAYLATMK
jgi:cytochrome c